MRVLDLFSGLGGWSAPFKAAGDDVITLDFNPDFGCDITADILTWDWTELVDWEPTLVLASPPCETFSVMSIGTHWTGGHRAYVPNTAAAQLATYIVEATVSIIQRFNPPAYLIENPRAVLRKLNLIPFPRNTTWYCHYGSEYAKPTDLWGKIPGWLPNPPCHNRRADHHEDCCCRDHAPAPRGSRTGIQGDQSAAERAVVPFALGAEIREALV
jgi:hypothetical protein